MQSREPHSADRIATLRILDAAANRAREALRVIEDFTRFTLDDAHLTGLLKNLRHDLTAALSAFPLNDLLAARDTLQDVGTSITTAAESQRSSPADVATAAFKRLQEALRTLEEFGKLPSAGTGTGAELGQRIEALRYQVYTLEKAVSGTRLNRDRLAGKNLYLLATESLCPRGYEATIRGALAGGVAVVQVREKSMPDRQLIDLGRRVRAWTREAGALYIMNDRADLAVLTDADGVHVGQEELTVREARQIVGPDRLVGLSTHGIEQARQAVFDGADYLGVGPVFPSGTKSFDSLAGLEFVRQAAAEISLPWYAIGGITSANIEEVVAAGATRVAVSAAICGADDPATSARELNGWLTNG